MLSLSFVAHLTLAQACFPEGVNASFVDAGTVFTQTVVGTETGLQFMSRVPTDWGYVDYIFDTPERTNVTATYEWRSNGTSLMSLDRHGSGGVATSWSAPYTYTNVIFPTVAGGISIESTRPYTDPDSALTIEDQLRSPLVDVYPMTVWRGPLGQVASMTNRGEMHAGTQWGSAAFTCSAGSSGAPCLACEDFGEGCYVPVEGHMHNDSRHGTFYVGDGNSRDAGGGWTEQFTADRSVIRQYNGPEPIGGNAMTVRYATTAGDLVLLGASIEPYFGNGTLPPCVVGTTRIHPEDGMGEGSIVWNHDAHELQICNPYDICDGGTGWRKAELR